MYIYKIKDDRFVKILLVKNELEIGKIHWLKENAAVHPRYISYAKSQAVSGHTSNFPGKPFHESVGAALKIYYIFDTSLSEALTYSWTCWGVRDAFRDDEQADATQSFSSLFPASRYKGS